MALRHQYYLHVIVVLLLLPVQKQERPKEKLKEILTLILKEKISRKTTLTLTIATVGMFVLSSVGPP